MEDKDLILAIDNGTQSLKALIFDLKGRLLFKKRVLFKPYFSEQPGWPSRILFFSGRPFVMPVMVYGNREGLTRKGLPGWP